MHRSSPTPRRQPASPALDGSLEGGVDGWSSGAPQPLPGDDPAETARYIAQLTGELAALAGAAQLDTLAYLLAMARVEAEVAARS